jgi:hypothetical protein
MNYELISEDDYATLSDDDEECFVQFEAICRRNMTRMINASGNGQDISEIRSQYMAAIASVARECGVPDVNVPRYDEEQAYDTFLAFCNSVQGEVARIRIRGRRFSHALSVQLVPNTKTKIQHYVGRLQGVIDGSDLSGELKETLNAKLTELLAELEQRRFSFGKAMALLSSLLVGFAAATTIAAEGPAAVTSIMKLIASDKESENAAHLRLESPQKRLPGPTS